MEWQSIDTAPKGKFKVVSSGKRGTLKSFLPERILTTRVGDAVRISWFLPKGVDGAESRERWNFYTADHPPTHWMPLPAPPKANDWGVK